MSEHDLYDHVVYRCVVGSHAHGLATASSDVDRRGVYLPPAELHWSLAGVPEQLERRETDEVYWELRKFVALALKANPNVLEALYTPLVERSSPVADELRAMRGAFLSKRVYETYSGYARSQFRRMQHDLRARGAVNWKHPMHLVRLLLAAVTTLREGHVPVAVDARYRHRLLAIKRGEVPWVEVDAWRLALHEEVDDAYASTALPDEPDRARADAFLVRARRAQVHDAAA